MNQEHRPPEARCRIVLSIVADPDLLEPLKMALAGGDVASIIISPYAGAPAGFTEVCKQFVEAAQANDVASLVANDTVVMGRSGADGLLAVQPDDGFRELAARISPQKLIGFGGSFSRHRAMELGEADPDFLFFGKINGDIRDEPHPKNLSIAQWWAEVMEIPCIVMGGKIVESVVECAASGAEFVALSQAVFGAGAEPQLAVAKANALLDQHAPILDDQV